MVIDCSGLRIANSAFNDTPIKWADINAENIPRNIFCSCSNLEYVHIGSSVEIIEPYAFNDCTVKSIKTEDGLKYIGIYAFNTNEVTLLNLPDTVEIMGILPMSTGYYDIGATGKKAVNNLKEYYSFGFFSNDSLVYVYDNLYSMLNPRGTDKNIRLFGDTNNDGKVTVADAVSLHKYLLGNCSLGYEADLTKDGVIDSFDMVCMRKMILNKQ